MDRTIGQQRISLRQYKERVILMMPVVLLKQPLVYEVVMDRDTSFFGSAPKLSTRLGSILSICINVN